MRSSILALLAAIVIAAPAAITTVYAADDDKTVPFVAVTAIVRDAAIDALYTGMTDALRDAGYVDGDTVRLRFESAQADAAQAAQLVQSFSRERADIIVVFTEPSARIAANEPLRIPLVIAGIGPVTGDELRKDREARLLTGIVDAERYDTQLAFIREIAPTARNVAIPVNADKPPDRGIWRLMRAFARGIDLTIEQLPVSVDKGLIAATIESYAPDKTVILLDKRIFPDAPVERIIAAAEATNLLVFASDEDTVVRGALAAIITEPYGVGRQLGRLVARILKKPSAARTPLQTAEPTYFVINQDTATRNGIEIPDPVLARRGRIIGWADIDGPRPRGKPVPPPSATPVPEVIEAPVTTEAPETPEKPAATEAPVVTKVPEASEKPAAPKAPVAIEAPEVPEKPEKPATTEPPLVVKIPEVLERPEKPKVTEKTEEPEEPEVPESLIQKFLHNIKFLPADE